MSTLGVVGLIVLAGALGAALASFAAVAVERGGSGSSLLGRSRCVCGRPVPAWHNIPVVSYLVLRGRARCCGARIPVWYFAFELLGAALGVGAALAVVVAL